VRWAWTATGARAYAQTEACNSSLALPFNTLAARNMVSRG
jgi:hypothetical protein